MYGRDGQIPNTLLRSNLFTSMGNLSLKEQGPSNVNVLAPFSGPCSDQFRSLVLNREFFRGGMRLLALYAR